MRCPRCKGKGEIIKVVETFTSADVTIVFYCDFCMATYKDSRVSDINEKYPDLKGGNNEFKRLPESKHGGMNEGGEPLQVRGIRG